MSVTLQFARRNLAIYLLAIFSASLSSAALGDEWLTANELRVLYSNAHVDTEVRGKSRRYNYSADGTVEFSYSGTIAHTFWWVESPGSLCRPTSRTQSGKICWRHKKNDKSYTRYHPDRDESQASSPWRLSLNSEIRGEGRQPPNTPSAEIVGRFLSDNLGVYVTDDPDEVRVRDSLAEFQKAFLAADGASLRGMVSEDFKQIEEIQGKALPAVDRTRAFDFEGVAKPYERIEFNLKSVTKNVSSGTITAIVASSYHGKYFTERYLETYSYLLDKSVGKLQHQTRLRFSVTNPKLHDVQIHVRRQISKNAIKDAFASPTVDAKLDKVLGEANDLFPWSESTSVLFIFREPPRVGSIVRTHIGIQKFDYKVTTSEPYFLVANEAELDVGNGKVPMAVYVDGDLVAFRSMSHVKPPAEAEQCLSDVPLPGNMKVTRADKGISPNIGEFVGKWCGRLPNGRDIILVVEKVNRDGRASIIYALSKSPRFDAFYEIVSGSISDGVLRFSLPNGAALTYELIGKNELTGKWSRNSQNSSMSLKRGT